MKQIKSFEDYLNLREKAHDLTFSRFSGDIAFLVNPSGPISIYSRAGELKQEIDVEDKWINAILYHYDLNEGEPRRDTLYVSGAMFGKANADGTIEEILHSHKDTVTLENGKNFFDALFDSLIFGMASNHNLIEFYHDNEGMRVLYHPSEKKFYIGSSLLQEGYKIGDGKAVPTSLPAFVDSEIENLKIIKKDFGVLSEN